MGRKLRVLLFAPLFMAILIGCKSSATPAKVSGKITYKGQPVTGGTVTFHPTDGSKANYLCRIQPDGTYSGTDIAAGDMMVTVETESINPAPAGRPKMDLPVGGQKEGSVYNPKAMLDKMKQTGRAPEDAGAVVGTYVPIPLKYGDKEKGGLTATLTKGSNKKDFDLTD